MGMKIFSFILSLNDLGQLHNGFIRGLRNDNLLFFKLTVVKQNQFIVQTGHKLAFGGGVQCTTNYKQLRELLPTFAGQTNLSPLVPNSVDYFLPYLSLSTILNLLWSQRYSVHQKSLYTRHVNHNIPLQVPSFQLLSLAENHSLKEHY